MEKEPTNLKAFFNAFSFVYFSLVCSQTQAKRNSAEPEDSSNEGGVTDGDVLDESPLPPRKRTKTRQLSPELTWLVNDQATQ